MAKELVISMTPEGYSLNLPTEKRGAIKYQQILRGGTYLDLKNSLANLPEGFYEEGIAINFDYNNEFAPIKIPKDKKEELTGIIRTLEESDKIFGKISK